MKKIIPFLCAAILLASCGGATVNIISSPDGANIEFMNQKAKTPATFTGVKAGDYDLSGTRTGYLPQKMKVHVDENGDNQFSLIFEKEIVRPVVNFIDVPMDGMMVRSTIEPKKYIFTAYDPMTGVVGKQVPVDGPSSTIFDAKLLRAAGKVPNGSMLVQMFADGNTCWADVQPGTEVTSAMQPYKMLTTRPAWDYPKSQEIKIDKLAPEKIGDKQVIKVGGTEIGSCQAANIFEGRMSGGRAVWSFIDDQGRQSVIYFDGKQAKTVWYGEYGIGALEYLGNTSWPATICDNFIFASLATDTGYRICALDLEGKILDSTQVFDYQRTVDVKKIGNVYGIRTTTKNEVMTTFTFDGKKFVELPAVDNGDFSKTTGIWIPIGKNFEIRITETLSVMLVPSKDKYYKVVYAGSRF